MLFLACSGLSSNFPQVKLFSIKFSFLIVTTDSFLPQKLELSAIFQKAGWAKGSLASAITPQQIGILNGENLQSPEEHKRTHELSSGQQYHLWRKKNLCLFLQKSIM